METFRIVYKSLQYYHADIEAHTMEEARAKIASADANEAGINFISEDYCTWDPSPEDDEKLG